MNNKDLENQMIRGQINTHQTLSDMSERINDLEAFVFGINDAIIEKNVISSKYLFKKIEQVRKNMMDSGEMASAGIALRKDTNIPEENTVNCAERMHICKAICCKLNFPLNAEEVESGIVKWDLGRPYYIRHDAGGFCCHKGASGQCGVYNNRPVVCRTYSCKDDERIWKDFDNMVINEEWINQNLTGGLPADPH